MRKYIGLVGIGIVLMSCHQPQKTSELKEEKQETVQVPDGHTAENALDYWGVYEGTLPAASCPGIKTVLTLNKDNTFDLHSEYIDEKDGVFDEKGTYTLQGNLLTARLKDGQVYYYKVEEGRIRMLNADKEVITGQLAENYILKQTKTF